VTEGRFRIDWLTPSGAFLAFEPTLQEVEVHAAALAAAWNDPHNAALMGHDDPFDAQDVVAHYGAMQFEGARTFLLFLDGQLAGDADFRGRSHDAAEFAFMVAAKQSQGKGLGTRFALMLHAFAFSSWGLQHSYASIVPVNTASRRVFEKLGFSLDASPAARAFADEEKDLVMSIERATFERVHAAVLPEIRSTLR
jgi:RimJ/RimL family protein N-acetyltransferase